MDTGDIACKLIHMLDLLCSRAGMVHGLGHRTDLLPLVIREYRRMQPSIALLLILDGSPVIAWGIGSIKLIAQHGRHRVFSKESGTKALTPGPIAFLIQRISDLVSLDPLHAQLAKQMQSWVLFGVKLRR